VALGVAVWLAAESSDTIRAAVLGIALTGAVAVAAALVWPPALPAAVVLPGAAYATLVAVDDPPLDGRAAVLAACLVTVAGLADWSIELRTTSPDEPGGRWRRLAWIALWAICSLALGGALLALVDLARTDGFLVEVIGVVAALAALALVARLARPPHDAADSATRTPPLDRGTDTGDR
jgi:hypothetical protein